MTEFVKYPNSPIAADGWPIIAVGFLIGLAIWILFAIVQAQSHPFLKTGLAVAGLLAIGFFVFSVWFFRNPERVPAVTTPDVVISSADGTVLKVESVTDLRYSDQPSKKISIFMSPFDVHVNRAPVTGIVEKAEYVPGRFFVASLDKASTDNERNLVIMRTEQGQRVGFLQIAGLVARRIVCRIHAGDRLNVGQRYGMIRFGSRMEIFLPAESEVLVKSGDKLMAGHSVVARLPKN